MRHDSLSESICGSLNEDVIAWNYPKGAPDEQFFPQYLFSPPCHDHGDERLLTADRMGTCSSSGQWCSDQGKCRVANMLFFFKVRVGAKEFSMEELWKRWE